MVPETIVYVHPDNWQAFQIFEMCFTQWRMVVGMGGVGYQGLDYAGVWPVIECHVKPKHRPRVFRQIQLIERGALSTING